MLWTTVALLTLLQTVPLASSPAPARPEAAPVAEAPPQSAAVSTPTLKYNLSTDGVITAIAAGVALGMSRGQEGTDPLRSPILRCRWCDASSSGALDLNGLDDFGARARWKDARQAGDLSDYFKFGIIGAAVAGPFTWNSDKAAAARELGVVAEAVAITTALTTVVKITARRARPYTHDAVAAGSAPRPVKSDDNWSYFSGHASTAFSFVAASRKIAALRGDRKAKQLWTYAGFGAASLVGYLRIAAGKHYLTDVLTGAAVGTAVGTWMPRTAKVAGASVSVSPTAGSAGLAVTARW